MGLEKRKLDMWAGILIGLTVFACSLLIGSALALLFLDLTH
jgi:hypothetical protein